MKKINLLFLLPGPDYRPDLPNFRDKYEMLSKNFKGTIFSWTTNKDFKTYRIGDFVFYGLIRKKRGYITRLKLAFFVFWKSCWLHYKGERFDVILAYDPVFTGVIGSFLKYIFHCKLIIEINSSNSLKAVSLEEKNLLKRLILVSIYRILIFFSLNHADSIKLLVTGQKLLLDKKLQTKNIFCFHDFVPTHYFMNANSLAEKYILFVGFPFFRKGVDILVRAFEVISYKHPEFRLKLIGHRLRDEARYYLPNWDEKVNFCKPIFYDKLKEEFLKCYCFVLPSREEGMGRVLLEAMASSKAIIGANVGGIPEIIEDGKSGFLFKSEDVNDLASKLDILLGNPQLAKEMGEYGRELINTKFSSEKYCEFFTDMIEKTLRN